MPAFPFRDAVAVLAAAMCLAVLAASPARAQESGPSLPDSVTVQNVALPDNVGTDGAFTTFVPFDIPGFRGLEPALGLRYNSQWRGTGPDSYVAHGWRLAGLSAIEKRSVGGGRRITSAAATCSCWTGWNCWPAPTRRRPTPSVGKSGTPIRSATRPPSRMPAAARAAA
ncbi:MAG: hypothetical protein JKP98_03760 [Rhodobacteraceae bacterium]|nr:hypothetical protein [Paracoccaceae bacterium]